jgi:NADH:ubiquinone oxidoreductase subunit F (NADH-binding)
MRDIVGALKEGNLPTELALCHAPVNGEPAIADVPRMEEIPFYAKQKKIAMRNCGFIDPDSLPEYVARGGYRSLHKVLTSMTPEEVIEELIKSGLRGRGGAGFPTGLKWRFCREAAGEEKFIVCNADEGDPGAYMDRAVLEGDPHAVLEGMAIGAYAIGSSEGYIYVRDEYPLAIQKLEKAIADARAAGLLGKAIFGQGFYFNVHLSRGGGAFVCGEETSLLHSIEGKMGDPEPRPPFPAQRGLWGKPTNVNNVESWANVPQIMDKGSEWYASIGTEGSKGTKVFSLVGKVKNTGLVEVPMGVTLREIVYDIGGGILDDGEFKAVQTGGPSGGAEQDRLDHGLGRHDHHGPEELHGGCRPLLPRLPQGGVVWQVRALPGGDPAHAGHPQQDLRGKGGPRGPRPAPGPGPDHLGLLALRAGRHRPQPSADDPQVLPGRVRRPHQREAVPGRRLQGADRVLHRVRPVRRLRRLHEGLPLGRDRGRRQAASHLLPREVHQVRRVPRGVQALRDQGRLGRMTR